MASPSFVSAALRGAADMLVKSLLSSKVFSVIPSIVSKIMEKRYVIEMAPVCRDGADTSAQVKQRSWAGRLISLVRAGKWVFSGDLRALQNTLLVLNRMGRAGTSPVPRTSAVASLALLLRGALCFVSMKIHPQIGVGGAGKASL